MHCITFFASSVLATAFPANRRVRGFLAAGILVLLGTPFSIAFVYTGITLVLIGASLGIPEVPRLIHTIASYTYEYYLIHGIFLIGTTRALRGHPAIAVASGVLLAALASVPLQKIARYPWAATIRDFGTRYRARETVPRPADRKLIVGTVNVTRHRRRHERARHPLRGRTDIVIPADRHPDPRRPAEPDLREVAARLAAEEETIRQGGGPEAIARQHAKGRKTARERIAALIDPDSPFLELGLWAGYQMYEEWGGAPAAGVVTGIGRVAGRRVMIVANDATVKAGAFFPMTIKKVLRAQAIAGRESAAADLPRRLLGGLPADAGRGLPRRRRLRPDLPQQRGPLGARHPPDRGDHGQLRRGRGVPAGPLRHRADDRGVGPLPRRAGAGQGGDRPGRHLRGAGRRRHARGDQRDGRLPRAGRRRLPRPAPPTRRDAPRRPEADRRRDPDRAPAAAGLGGRRDRHAPTRRPSTTCAT